jgi:hypothetical protein
MVPDSFPPLKQLVSTLGLWVVLVLSVVLLVRVLPIPDSPFFLGVSIAIVYGGVKQYVARDGDSRMTYSLLQKKS